MEQLIKNIVIPMNLLFKELSKKELLYIVLKNIDLDNFLDTTKKFNIEILDNFETFNKVPLKKILEKEMKKEMLISYIYENNLLNPCNKNLLTLQLYKVFPMEINLIDVNLNFNKCIYEILDYRYRNTLDIQSNFNNIYDQLVSTSKLISNLLYTIILLGKISRNNLLDSDTLCDIEVSLKKVFVINLVNLNNYYIDLNLMEFDNLYSQLEKYDKKISQKENKINTYKEKVKKLNIENKNLNKLLKDKQNIDKSIIEEEYKEELNKKNKCIEVLSDKIKILEKDNKNIINNNLELQKLLKAKETEIMYIKKDTEKTKNDVSYDLNDEKVIEYIKDKGIHQKLFKSLKPYIDIYTNNHTDIQENKVNIECNYNKNHKEFGYCILKDNKIFVVFANNTIHELKNLPEDVYLAQYQFVLVNNQNDCSFMWAYNCKFDNMFNILKPYTFALVEKRGEKIFINKLFDELEELEKNKRTSRLNDLQIIAVEYNTNNLIRYYKMFKPLINDFEDCIKMKQQTPYFILKKLSNGCFVRNIFTEEEKFLNIEHIEKLNINNQDIIITNSEDIVIKTFKYSVFYTLSPLYKKKEFGYINMIDNSYFIKKISGENVILNNIPPTHTFKNGDNICIDEFNNYLYSETYKEEEIRNREKQKKKIAKTKSNIYDINEDVEFKNILIIGKPTYKNSYKLALYKNGYKCEVIDGYSAWNKINSEVNNKDAIVVITNYISHDNMWSVKKELNVPTIFSEHDGANRIVEQLDNLFI